MITEIFVTRIMIVITIIFIIATQNFNKTVQTINKKIHSKDKQLVKEGKIFKMILIVILTYLSVALTIVLINVTHQYFYRAPFIGSARFDKTSMIDKMAKQFYRIVETGRIIREVD